MTEKGRWTEELIEAGHHLIQCSNGHESLIASPDFTQIGFAIHAWAVKHWSDQVLSYAFGKLAERQIDRFISHYVPNPIFSGEIGKYEGWTAMEPHAEPGTEPDAPRKCGICGDVIRDGRCRCMIG